LTTLFSDLKLAQRLEEIEAFTAESYVRRLVQRRPGADVAIEEVAGGRAVFAGAGSPLSETKVVGLNGPVTDGDVDRMEHVFFSRGEPSRVVVCPLADPSLVDCLSRRDYRLSHFENILAMRLAERHFDSHGVPGIEVRPAEPGEADLYASVVAPNFVEPGGPVDEIREMAITMQGMEDSVAFLAFIAGDPVGGGAVIIHKGLALFAGAATLPLFRNRGVHAALHHARLAFALHSGCDLAAQGAAPGSTSHRNAERRGLRVAYTRALLVRDPA
jgi:hypothetical protein